MNRGNRESTLSAKGEHTQKRDKLKSDFAWGQGTVGWEDGWGHGGVKSMHRK